MSLCCQSCGDESRSRKKAYRSGSKNPNPEVVSCAETPLVTTDDQVGGSRSELNKDAAQGPTISGTMDDAVEVVDEEFAGSIISVISVRCSTRYSS